ncbi:uncharacterized protein LOC118433981 [Folsomia candida]|uniref:uncharacterized protein LOC118433981 n=1 Tax=Folsomia candida TaxID=158441 RepID=UPI001604A85C|nr:uncharacterized protein LOC118433981 [Folsomia candida]
MSALVYFLRWLRQKMVNLQHEILQQYSLNEKIVALEDIFLPTKVFHINKPQYQDMGFQLVEKLQKLIRIMREINLFSGEFILMFISLTLCMGIALLHVIIISLIGMGHINSSNPEIMKRGIFALTTVFVFSALKVSILVNAGEHLKSVRQNFIFSLDLIQPEKIHPDDRTILNLKRLIQNHKFEMNACGFFIVNRKLVVRVIFSIWIFDDLSSNQ